MEHIKIKVYYKSKYFSTFTFHNKTFNQSLPLLAGILPKNKNYYIFSNYEQALIKNCKKDSKNRTFKTIEYQKELKQIFDKWIKPDKSNSPVNYLNINYQVYSGLNASNLKENIEKTIKYYFDNLTIGIFISIRNRKINQFIHLTNLDFRNDWGIELDVKKYSEDKREDTGRTFEEFELDTSKWTANNCLLGATFPRLYSERRMHFIKEMINLTCQKHPVPDCDFMFNRRDVPTMTNDGSHPYED